MPFRKPVTVTSSCHAVPPTAAPPWRAALLAQALLAAACSSTTDQTPPADGAVDAAPDAPSADAPSSDAPPADVPPADAPSVDVPPADVPPADVPIGQDVPVDATLCGPRTDAAPFAPAADCSATAQAINAAMLCVDAAVCPVTANVALRCAMTGGYGPWVVATRTGATVLYATNQGGFRNTLFTIPETGAPEAPRLGPSNAVGRLAVDTSGRPVLIENENPGVATVHERDGVWRRAQASSSGADLLIATSGAFVDENNGYLAVYNVSGSASLATLRAGCWSSRPLPGMTQAFPNVAIDLNARPWAAWWLYEGGGSVLRLLDPDGRTHDLRAPEAGGIVGNAMPAMTADGANGRTTWPALADYRPNGLHVYTRGVADTAWRDRVLVAPPMEGASNCPPAMGGPPGGDACGGLTRCTEQTRGLSRAVGLARTGDGTLWAAWATHDYEVDYALSNGGCMMGGGGIVPPRCTCTRSETARRGGATVTLARVGDATVATTARFRVNAAGIVPELALAARGDALHLVVWEPSTSGTTLRYLAVDTRSIR
jgi:hypothetical protein